MCFPVPFYLPTTVCWEWVGQIIHISHSQVSKKRSGVAHEILDIMLQLGETLGKFWEDDECILWAVRKEMNIYDPVSRLWWNRLLLPVLLSLPVFGSCIHILCYLSLQYLLLEWVEYISLPKHWDWLYDFGQWVLSGHNFATSERQF